MARRLPPLNALRAFEAAARHESLTRAAEELHVTQGAVSRQVKALEAYYGFPLFARGHRHIALTEAGRLLMRESGAAFDRISSVSDSLRRSRRDLRVRLVPTFALRWLMPRLHRFQHAHPDVQVRLTTSSDPAPYSPEYFDLAVVYGPLDQPGILEKLIFPDRVLAVCAPSLLEDGHSIRETADLLNVRLLFDTPDGWAWRRWAEVVGWDGLDQAERQIFDTDEPALQAALAGFGVVLATDRLVASDIQAKRLVAPLDVPPVELSAYNLVYPEALSEEPRVAEFRDWLLAEAAEEPDAPLPARR